MKPAGIACYIRLRTKPGRRDEFVRLIKELQSNVVAKEPGTLFWELLQGPDPDEFVVLEGFVDEAARKAHAEADYHLEMTKAGWACVDGKATIEFMTPA